MQQIEEKVNALSKIADLVGKKTLVMWCILTTFTTGFLYIESRNERDKRITENSAAYERLVEEIKGIKHTTDENKKQIDSRIPRLDTAIENVNQTLLDIKQKK